MWARRQDPGALRYKTCSNEAGKLSARYVLGERPALSVERRRMSVQPVLSVTKT